MVVGHAARERGGRKRGRFGRERGGRGERKERSSTETNGVENVEAQSFAAPEVVSGPVEVARQPAIAVFVETAPEPELRKWQPPAPTVVAEKVERKGGWWSKRS